LLKSKKVIKIIGLSILAVAIAISITSTTTAQVNSDEYTIHIQQPWHQIENYPVTNQPIPPNYYPVAPWVGRLILPAEIGSGKDWVNLEIQQSPDRQLIGKVVKLEYRDVKKLGLWDVNFTDRTYQSIAQGNIHPTRLNKYRAIGALQSLAASRPTDNIRISFPTGKLVGDILKIDAIPTLTTGKIYSLVKIIDRDKSSNRFQVQHYNLRTKQFDDRIESVIIPSQAIDRRQFSPSTIDRLLSSPAGADGWYIYGEIDRQGIFTAQAIQPRALIKVDRVANSIFGLDKAQQFIDRDNWQIPKGELKTTSITTQPNHPEYRSGDRGLVLHLFGGIGGEYAESLGVPQTISGHFALGTAIVTTDPLTQELIWDIQYHQVYAHNPNGIIAGTHTWADYMGNLQWGWAATRPISDIIVTLPAITQDYKFDGIKISPLTELQHNLEIMMARYRVGDGSGSSTVSIATSCVQDTNQTLYSTLKNIQQQATNPQIKTWLAAHPLSEQTQRFQQLKAIGDALEKQLMPWGITRADWANNSLAGTAHRRADDSFWAGITSWRSILPRKAHDRLAMLFLRHGGDLQVLTTNQIGGWQSQITPLPPTSIFGLITVPFTNFAPLPIVISRILSAVTIPRWQDVGIGFLLLAIYGGIAIAIGSKSGFLQWQPQRLTPLIIWLFLAPALIEESIFRVLCLSHPSETFNWVEWSLWGIVSLFAFVIYHPINAKTFYRAGNPTFFHPVFLLLAGLLGTICSIAYALTGSLLVITSIHWLVVTGWIFYYGGMERLDKR
jgi:predicted Abi (CAAX) family protease